MSSWVFMLAAIRRWSCWLANAEALDPGCVEREREGRGRDGQQGGTEEGACEHLEVRRRRGVTVENTKVLGQGARGSLAIHGGHLVGVGVETPKSYMTQAASGLEKRDVWERGASCSAA